VATTRGLLVECDACLVAFDADLVKRNARLLEFDTRF
jgi:hypothetical protein